MASMSFFHRMRCHDVRPEIFLPKMGGAVHRINEYRKSAAWHDVR